MSATGQREGTGAAPATQSEADHSGASSGGGLGSASPRETLEVLLLGLVPSLVRGLFSPRQAAIKILTRTDADGRAVRALRRIRGRHDGQGIKLLGGRLVVLWGEQAIEEVLGHSADIYASDGGAKAKGMSHFQPDALTLSRGRLWRERRTFNEHILASRQPVHPLARRFVAVVAEEVRALPLTGELNWGDWETLFDRVSLRVIFGDRARERHDLTARLERLMAQANRIVGLKHGDDYYELFAALETELRDPDPESLIGLVPEAPHGDETRILQQVPHWMFAMRDTLASNSFRALAAIVADAEVQRRVREELEGTDLDDPEQVSAMEYLGGCLHEAMRLWPTTPLLARETTREATLAGEQLDAGVQVMLLNVFNHRDAEHVSDADGFVPERWAGGRRDIRFNHLSNGTQDCPGAGLVLLLGRTALGRVLEQYELTLQPSQQFANAVALQSGHAMPHMLDFFALRFAATPRSR